MSMRNHRIWFVFLLLALLSQGISAALAPCETDPSGGTNIAGAAQQHCPDEGSAEPVKLPAESSHDCAQQCACPAGPATFAAPAGPGSDLLEMSLSGYPESQRPTQTVKVLFRPPILS